MLFPGEGLADGPFVTLGVVEVHGGGFAPYNQMIRKLQAKAQTLGVDAVQLFDKQYNRRNLRVGRSHLYRHPQQPGGIGFVVPKEYHVSEPVCAVGTDLSLTM